MSRLQAATLLVLALGSAVLVGCAGSDEPALTPVAGSHSAYCRAYRSWKVYELDGGGAFDQTSANALRAWWNAYVTAEETMLEEAPPEIRSAVEVKVAVTPVVVATPST